jgi:hypothetical protein
VDSCFGQAERGKGGQGPYVEAPATERGTQWLSAMYQNGLYACVSFIETYTFSAVTVRTFLNGSSYKRIS